jgi:hypothetical protein
MRRKQTNKADKDESQEASHASPCDANSADLGGYSPATREAIRRRLKEEPEEGPEEEDFERAIRRSAEERKGD